MLGEVPDTPHSRQVRADLLAARDSKKSESFPESRIAGGLRIAQSHEPAQGPTIVPAALVDEEGVAQDYGLSFAGTLFVSWPLDAHLYLLEVRRFADLAQEAPRGPRALKASRSLLLQHVAPRLTPLHAIQSAAGQSARRSLAP